MKYLPGLNGLRAIAVTVVVWHHTRPANVRWPIAGNGFLGVDVFFVLSGFLITALLLEERQTHGEISLSGFYWRRFLRIFPLYFAILGLLSIYFLFATRSTERAAFLSQLPTNIAFLSNWFPSTTVMAVGWSLSTEEQFYLAWPPLVAVFGQRSIWFLLAFLVPNLAVNFGVIGAGDSRAIMQVTFTPIVLGSLLAFGLTSKRVRPWIEAVASTWRLYVVIALMMAIASSPGDMQGAPRLCFHALTALLLAGIVTRPDSPVVRLLEWRPLAYVGTVSYGVYLLHEIVLDRVVRGLSAAHLGEAWHFPACLAATVFVAGLSYRFFERPLLRLKSRRWMPAVRVSSPRP